MKVYGPYTNKSNNGRQHVIIIDKGKRRTVSYPKYLMEQHLGRELDPNKETIDHIDDDFTNNDLSNLRVIDRSNHSSEDNLRVRNVKITCVWCGSEAYKRPGRLDSNSKLGKAGPFCGRSCAGKYGKSVQMGEDKLPVQPSGYPREYYKIKDIPCERGETGKRASLKN